MKDLLGLCVGIFGDESTDMKRLIRGLTESNALFLSSWPGANRPISDRKIRHILGQYRQVLSVTIAQSQAACRVARSLGLAACECARRRRVAMTDGERMKKKTDAFHTAHIWEGGAQVPEGVLAKTDLIFPLHNISYLLI